MLPVGVHAEALEALALHVDVLLGPFAAEAAQRGLVDLRHLVGAERLLHHVLDRLAVAIPAGHVRREEAALRVGLVHEVLEDLVEGVADVDGAVGVRGAVVQDERLAVLVLLEHLLVDALFLPLGQPLRLVLGQVRPHREVGLGQVHRFLVTVRHGVPYLSFKHALRGAAAEPPGPADSTFDTNRYSIGDCARIARAPRAYSPRLGHISKMRHKKLQGNRYTLEGNHGALSRRPRTSEERNGF